MKKLFVLTLTALASLSAFAGNSDQARIKVFKPGTTLVLKTELAFRHHQQGPADIVFNDGVNAVITNHTAEIVCQLPEKVTSTQDLVLTRGTQLKVVGEREIWHSRYQRCVQGECSAPYATTEVSAKSPTGAILNFSCTRNGSDEALTSTDVHPILQNIVEWGES